MSQKTSLIQFNPGIRRDGTRFASRNWNDGVWTRFQRGLPRKMGGYKQIFGGLQNVPRKVFILPNSPNYNVYVADFETIQYFTIDQFGNVISPLNDRTPDLFINNLNNNYKFDTMFSTINESSVIIMHASQSLSQIDNEVETPVYYGDSMSTDAFQSTGISVSGSIAVFHPFLFMFGNSGDVKWSAPNDPTVVLDDARVTGAKIVAGSQTRGGNTSPAGLLWSLDSVIRVTQVGTVSIDFNFDTVTDESSILSSRSIIEYDGQFYWVGIDKFLLYNGTVQEIQNNLSTNFFFENINYSQRQKVWATKNTRFGEIWWFFPFGGSIECNWAVVYNIREQTWYDTPVNRGDGYFTQVFHYPIWADNDNPNDYGIWIHEKGYNKVDIDLNTTPIQSFIETSDFSYCGYSLDGQFAGTDKNTIIERIEPDFNQVGDMTAIIKKKKYASSPTVDSIPYTFTPETEKIDMREQGREVSIRFESNDIDGFYEMGNVLVVVRPGDDRP